MSFLRTFFIKDIVAIYMNALNVIPPNVSCLSVVIVHLVKALLSQILQYDFSPFDLRIACLNCTVLASSVAIIFHILLFTERTLPEYVSRCHKDLISELSVKRFEVSNKVKSSIVRRCHPYIILYSIIWFLHYERCHNGNTF